MRQSEDSQNYPNSASEPDPVQEQIQMNLTACIDCWFESWAIPEGSTDPPKLVNSGHPKLVTSWNHRGPRWWPIHLVNFPYDTDLPFKGVNAKESPRKMPSNPLDQTTWNMSGMYHNLAISSPTLNLYLQGWILESLGTLIP